MRSTFLWFLALLLLPSLVASRNYMPMPKHGDYVTYPPNGRGIVVGTEHQVYPGHPLRVAPLAHHSPSPPADVVVHGNQLVEMDPSHVRTTGHSDVAFASDIAKEHIWNSPTISPVSRRRVYSLIA